MMLFVLMEEAKKKRKGIGALRMEEERRCDARQRSPYGEMEARRSMSMLE